MDLISRQAAIDAFTGVVILEPAQSAKKYIDGVIERIQNLPSVQPEQHWIPCSERLPEEYGEYQITWITSVSKKRFIGCSEYEITGEYDFENDRFKGEWLLEDYVKAYPDVKVLAWMPLPEPWRGEEHEL